MYNQYISKWYTYCLIKNIDKQDASEAQVCDFLRQMSDDKYSYGAINAARCALSVVLPKTTNMDTMGRRYWVTRAVRTAYLRNPPKPKYTSFWDIRLVFKTIKKWGRNSKMSLKRLCAKVLCLMLLVSGQRGQMALALSLDKMEEWDDGSVTFVLLHPLKTAKTGESLLRLKFLPYHTDVRLCVVRALRRYIERTAEIRKSQLLFVSYVKPHKAVSRDTISRWVLHTMRVSGICTKRFGAHSLRGAGVSTGARLGISTDLLLKYGSWRNEATMAKHYLKKVEVTPRANLGEVLLDQAA